VDYFGGIEVDVGIMENIYSRWYTEIKDANFGLRNWALTTNTYKGLLNYYPDNYTQLNPFTDNSNAALMWSIFMPKWQPDDYYEDNFRLNKGDTVEMLFKDSCTMRCNDDPSVVFKSGGSATIETGATALAASIGIAFAAAALTF